MVSKIVRHKNLPAKPTFAESIASAGLVEGRTKTGTISRVVESLGIFVRPDGSDYDAFVFKNSIGPRPINNPEAIGFAPGERVTIRVTQIDHEKQRIQGTLVDPNATLFTLRPEIKEQDRLPAIVDAVEPDRLFVQTLGGIRMFVPRTETGVVMSRTDDTVALEDHFSVGEPLEVIVLRVDKERGHAMASIRHALDDTQPVQTSQNYAAPLTATLSDIQVNRAQRKKQRSA
jgi:ribosomal protein S1